MHSRAYLDTESDDELRKLQVGEKPGDEGYDDIQRVLDERQAKREADAAAAYANSEEAKARAKEAKIARGTAPADVNTSDVVARLKKMGVTTNEMPAALDAYYNAHDAYGRNENLTPEEFAQDLKVRGYHESQIKRMMKFADIVAPVVKADLGYASPDQKFPDEVSRKNYLIANHFSDAEIAEIDRTTPSVGHGTTQFGTKWGTPEFYVPEAAKEKIVEQYAKQAKAKVKRSQEQNEEQFRIDQVEAHNANSVPGQLREKTAEQLAQIAGNLGVEHYNRGAPKYTGENFAAETQEEKDAEAILRSTAPGPDRDKEIAELKARGSKQRLASEAAKPYMEKASRDIDEDYKNRYADLEERDEQNLLEKMNKNYVEKIAPTIRQNYLSNNVTGHSRIAQDQKQALIDINSETAKAIHGLRSNNRQRNYDIIGKDRAKDAALAAQAGDFSSRDTDSEMKALQASEALSKTAENEKLAHMERLGALGMKKKEDEQAKLNLKKEEWKDEKDHIKNSAAFLADIAHGNPLYGIHEPQKMKMPERNPKTFKATAGAGLMNAGMDSFKKEGGRVHRAEGGGIDPQQAIDSAVTQGTTPAYEIGRMNNKYVTNAAGIGYLKARNAQKQAYAIGGNVNPIIEGANDARAVAEEERREKYNQLRDKMMQPEVEEQVSPVRRYINAFMTGAANTGNNDFLARAGKGHVAMQQADAEKAKDKRETKGKHDDLVAKLMKEHQEDYNHRATHSLNEKKHLHDIEMGKSTQGMNAAHAKLLEMQAKELEDRQKTYNSNAYGLTADEMPTAPVTQANIDEFSGANTKINAAQALQEKTQQAAEVAGKIDSGWWTGVASLLGPNAAALWSGSKADDINKFDTINKDFMTNYQTLHSVLGEKAQGRLAQAYKVFLDSKPSLWQSKEANLQKYTNASNEIIRVLQYEKENLIHNHAPVSKIRQIDGLIKDYTAGISKLGKAELKDLEQKETPSHNDTYATSPSNDDAEYERYLALKKKKSA